MDLQVTIVFLLTTILISIVVCDEEPNKIKETAEDDRHSKLLPVFQVVRFPNDPCQGSGGTKNGTCYTSEECDSKGGTNAGTCASGFGVCCTFSIGCGRMSQENCTYFQVASGAATSGQCSAKICKCSNTVCQIRLDFMSFVISGPSTTSISVAHLLGGEVVGVANGVAVAEATQCLTDTFQVRNQVNLPYICGTMTGEHVYFEASDACNDLDFQFGSVAVGLGSLATREFNIKVTQYDCNYDNLAPVGCDQFYYGAGATGYVTSFNWAGSKHLADQSQTVCIRREINQCRICWSADAKTDIQLSLDTNKSSGIVTGTICCGYSMEGKGIDNKGAYDCLMIPGAITTKSALNPESMCGGKAGLVTKKGDNGSKTICSKAMPFRISFHSDSYEMSAAAMDEGTGANTGFKLRYFQTGC